MPTLCAQVVAQQSRVEWEDPLANEQPKASKRTFPCEFKLEARALAETGEKPIAQLERNLRLSDGLLRHWMPGKAVGQASARWPIRG